MTLHAVRGAVFLGAIAATVATATAAPSAGEQQLLLRPGVSIAKIRLGMTLAEVRGVLGPPRGVFRRERSGFARYTEYQWGLGPSWNIGFYQGVYGDPEVVVIGTTHRARTRSGVGTGSRHHALRRALGARCFVPPLPPKRREYFPGYPLIMVCVVGDDPRTTFTLVNRCSIPTDRYHVCPPSKRRYFAYDVGIVSSRGRRAHRSGEGLSDWLPVR